MNCNRRGRGCCYLVQPSPNMQHIVTDYQGMILKMIRVMMMMLKHYHDIYGGSALARGQGEQRRPHQEWEDNGRTVFMMAGDGGM